VLRQEQQLITTNDNVSEEEVGRTSSPRHTGGRTAISGQHRSQAEHVRAPRSIDTATPVPSSSIRYVGSERDVDVLDDHGGGLLWVAAPENTSRARDLELNPLLASKLGTERVRQRRKALLFRQRR
jgi:hypothetical protein